MDDDSRTAAAICVLAKFTINPVSIMEEYIRVDNGALRIR